MTPDPPPDRYVLELVALPDPHAGHGRPARSGEYRLKLALKDMLRGFGLKCVRASPAPAAPVQPPASEPAACLNPPTLLAEVDPCPHCSSPTAR